MNDTVNRLAAWSLLPIAALASSSVSNAQDPAATIDWSARALADIQAAHKHMLENHPGPVNDADPGFLDVAADALAESTKLAKQADSAPKWRYTLMSYSAHFKDGHFGIYTVDIKQSPTPRWPGLILAWRDGKALVHYSTDEAEFPVGAEVLACDGKAVTECLLGNRFRFFGNADIDGSWAQETPMLLHDDGNPFVQAPSKIRLRLADSTTVERALTWKEIEDQNGWRERRMQAVDGPRYPTSIEALANGISWIRLTDFQPDGKGQERFETMMASIRANLDSVRGGKAIVIDLRRNNGGSSFYPLEVAKLVWGEGHVEWRFDQPDQQATYVEWRSSAPNVETMRSYVPMLKEQGWSADQLGEFGQLVDGLAASLAAGDALFRDVDDPSESDATVAAAEVASPVSAPVFVVISGRCASAALDAIDIFKHFDNVTLVGATTSADTNYMEIRQNALPSGNATLYCPMKVYRNRARESNEPYHPDIPYNHVDWSDKTLMPWLLRTIEERLSGKFSGK